MTQLANHDTELNCVIVSRTISLLGNQHNLIATFTLLLTPIVLFFNYPIDYMYQQPGQIDAFVHGILPDFAKS